VGTLVQELFTTMLFGDGVPVNNLAIRAENARVCLESGQIVPTRYTSNAVDKLWTTIRCRMEKKCYAVISSLKEREWKAADARKPLEVPR